MWSKCFGDCAEPSRRASERARERERERERGWGWAGGSEGWTERRGKRTFRKKGEKERNDERKKEGGRGKNQTNKPKITECRITVWLAEHVEEGSHVSPDNLFPVTDS